MAARGPRTLPRRVFGLRACRVGAGRGPPVLSVAEAVLGGAAPGQRNPRNPHPSPPPQPAATATPWRRLAALANNFLPSSLPSGAAVQRCPGLAPPAGPCVAGAEAVRPGAMLEPAALPATRAGPVARQLAGLGSCLLRVAPQPCAPCAAPVFARTPDSATKTCLRDFLCLAAASATPPRPVCLSNRPRPAPPGKVLDGQ